MSDKPEAKGRLASLLHWYLNDPVSLAFSSAFTCGMVGLMMGVLVTSLFTTSLVTTGLVGGCVSLLAAFVGARQQLNSKTPRTTDEKAEKQNSSELGVRWFGLWYGASIMSVVALEVFGAHGTPVLLASLINGSLLATMLACVLNRR